MISYIKGIIDEITQDGIVVECGGIGYNILTSSHFISNDEVKIYTYMSVREDAMQLYGFKTKEEREMFKLLITVSGIGPKGALGILSNLSVNDLQIAIMSEDSKMISKSPGIGPKTAKKLILELKDKISHLSNEGISNIDINDTPNTNASYISEATEALIALGYSPSEAHKAINSAAALLDDNSVVDDYLKMALKQLAK